MTDHLGQRVCGPVWGAVAVDTTVEVRQLVFVAPFIVIIAPVRELALGPFVGQPSLPASVKVVAWEDWAEEACNSSAGQA